MWPTGRKAFAGVVLLAVAMALPTWWGRLVFWAALSLAIVAGMGIPTKRLVCFYRIPMAFLLWSTLAMSVGFGGAPERYLVLVRPFGQIIGFRQEGLMMALGATTRSLAALAALGFLVYAMRPVEWLRVLRRMGLPVVVVEQAFLMFRFITVFRDVLRDMTTAMAVRCGDRTFMTRMRSFGMIAAGLFVRVMRSYRRWQESLEVRLYDGTFPIEGL